MSIAEFEPVQLDTKIEKQLLGELEERFGVVTNHLNDYWISLLEESIEFDLKPNPQVTNLGFLTHREILERRIRVEELCGIDTSETKRDLGRRSIRAGVYIQP